MTTATAPAWWQTAPNPACSPWCSGDHKPDEFSIGAGFLCKRPVDGFTANTSEIEVSLVQYQGGEDEPGAIEQFPAEVHVRVSHGDLSLSFAEAIDFGERLTTAAHKAKAIAEGRT